MQVCSPGMIARRRASGSRPTSATRSGWRGCSPPANWAGRRPVAEQSSCATWCAAARTARRPDARPAPDRQVPVAPRALLPGPRRALDAQAPHVAALLRFDDTASELMFADYLHAHDLLLARRDRSTATSTSSRRAARGPPTIARLRCLRGIDTLSALGLCAEICDFDRFAHPDRLAATSGSSRPSTAPATSAARARSPRPAPATPAGCSSRRRWHYAARRASAASCSPASAAPALGHRPRLARPAPALPPLAARCAATAASAPGSSRSPSPANWPHFCWEITTIVYPSPPRPAARRRAPGAARASRSRLQL